MSTGLSTGVSTGGNLSGTFCKESGTGMTKFCKERVRPQGTVLGGTGMTNFCKESGGPG